MSAAAPVGVIGSGLGGLAAACTLAARGHRVVLFEKNPWLGGKAAQHQEAGWRFDMGPTILTVPSVLERIFAEAGERMDASLDLRRIDPQWRCFFEDGLGARSRPGCGVAMAQRLRSYSPQSEAGYGRVPGAEREAARGQPQVLLLALGRGTSATRSTSRRTWTSTRCAT